MAGTLADLQAALQGDIMRGSAATLPRLSVPQGATPEARLHVYQNAYLARLIEILSEDYDTTWTFAGDQAFYDLAVGYVRDCPSQTPNARWFGHRFPEFVEAHPTVTDVPAVADIARLERALADAFDAADAPVMGQGDLAALGSENVGQAVFDLHPSVTLLGLRSNAYDIFNALRNETPPPAPETREDPDWIVVWRSELMCRHARLDAEQGILLDHVRQGFDFARLCEISALTGEADSAAMRMAGYLQSWIGLGLFSAVRVG